MWDRLLTVLMLLVLLFLLFAIGACGGGGNLGGPSPLPGVRPEGVYSGGGMTPKYVHSKWWWWRWFPGPSGVGGYVGEETPTYYLLFQSPLLITNINTRCAWVPKKWMVEVE